MSEDFDVAAHHELHSPHGHARDELQIGLYSVALGFYTVSQKNKTLQTLGHNFTNYYPIFKIFSPANSAVNLQQIRV